MPDLSKDYELKLQKAIADAQRKIQAIYDQAIYEIVIKSSSLKFRGKTFSLSTFPLLNNFIKQRVKAMHKDIYSEIVKSIEKSWDLSNKKNDLIVDRRLAGKIPTAKGRLTLYDPNKGALEAFIKRADKGLNLSKRVWKSLDSFPSELEKSLFVGINEGRSASSMATQVKKYLNEPDKLFRRVREIKGDPTSKLRLSKAAKEYHPGQGVYRSSRANAFRLTRTENNLAYQTADFERWQTLPFVKGIEVSTSNNHPEYDICDQMAGEYPVTFHFVSWHPNCRCHATPILANGEEYNKIELALLRGEQPPVIDKIKTIPAKAKQYVEDNADRINGWSNTPYFVRNNPGFIGKLLK